MITLRRKTLNYMAQTQPQADTDPQLPTQRQVVPGHEAITITFGPIDPAKAAWDEAEDGDVVLVLGNQVPDDQVGAVIQTAIDRLWSDHAGGLAESLAERP